MAEIIPLISTTMDSNVYIIKDEKTAIIDSGSGLYKPLIETIKEKTGHIDYIINTHAHTDHCGGNRFLDGEVLIHERDSEEAQRGTYFGTGMFTGKIGAVMVDRTVKEGDVIDLGELKLTVLNTPGHTPGSICLYEEKEGFLFSGDTLFPDGGFGRTDLGGSDADMVASLDRVASLDIEVLYPGHMQVVTGDVREHQDFALESARMMFKL
jgi:glyoxylase-like metal-dependent hydrolase (beta-lactamase superfamily II)